MIRTFVAARSAGLLWSSLLWRTIFAGLLFLQLPHISAQTYINGSQIRNPLTPVAALPTACTPYSTYFLTTTNSAYICTATNTLTPLSAVAGGPGPSSTSQLTDFAPSLSNGTVTIQPGRIRFTTSTCTNFTGTATAAVSAISGGSGIAKLYVSSTCALVMQYPNNLTITWTLTAMTAQPVATPTVPSDAWYIGDLNIGPSVVTAVTDKRAVINRDPIIAGTGVVVDCTLGPCLASVDAAVVPTLGGANAYTGMQDFSAASVTKPNRSVASDPNGSCANNSEVVLSTASGNSFSCLAGNWHAMGGSSGGGSSGGSSGAGSTSQLTDFAPSLASGSLTIQPGRIRFNTTSCTNFTSPATAAVSTMSGGAGVAKLYISSNCVLVMQYPNSLTINWTLAGMTAQAVLTPGVPSDAWYIGDINIGPSAITAVSENRSVIGVDPASGSGGGTTGGAIVSQYLTTGNPQVVSDAGDLIIVTSNTLPPLAVGACWDYETFFTANQSWWPKVKLWFGSGQNTGSDYSSGSSLASDTLTGQPSGNNPAAVWLRGQICNNNGVQNAQTATLFSQFYNNHGITSGAAGSMSQDTTATNLQIGISVSGAEGLRVQSFRVWLTQ